MEGSEVQKFKANWHPMQQEDFASIISNILTEVLATPQELMQDHAKSNTELSQIKEGESSFHECSSTIHHT